MTHPYSKREYLSALNMGESIVELVELNASAIYRKIPDTGFYDLFGAYPFNNISKPQNLESLSALAQRVNAVSYVTITDCLGADDAWYQDYFDFAKPYKNHFLFDRDVSEPEFSKHHRYEIKKASRLCEVREIALSDYLFEWCDLYAALIESRGLGEMHQFPKSYFEALAKMPCFVVLGAFIGSELVSAHIWLRFDGKLYSHLAASNSRGYNCGASYVIYKTAVTNFTDCGVIDFGGVPDIGNVDGLRRFKSGFSNDIRSNWICGLILDNKQYLSICRLYGVASDSKSYFPAYRGGLKG